MKKIIYTFFLLLFITCTSSFSQTYLGISVGPQFPVGALGDRYTTGMGGVLSAKFLVSENLALGANFGVNNFALGQDPANRVHNMFMPITGSVEYFSSGMQNFKAYVGSDVGLYRITHRIRSQIVNNQTISDSYFGIAPTAGFMYSLSDNVDFNANAKFHIIFSEAYTSTFLGISAGLFYVIGR